MAGRPPGIQFSGVQLLRVVGSHPKLGLIQRKLVPPTLYGAQRVLEVHQLRAIALLRRPALQLALSPPSAPRPADGRVRPKAAGIVPGAAMRAHVAGSHAHVAGRQLRQLRAFNDFQRQGPRRLALDIGAHRRPNEFGHAQQHVKVAVHRAQRMKDAIPYFTGLGLHMEVAKVSEAGRKRERQADDAPVTAKSRSFAGRAGPALLPCVLKRDQRHRKL
jgi:hypothetical protein